MTQNHAICQAYRRPIKIFLYTYEKWKKILHFARHWYGFLIPLPTLIQPWSINLADLGKFMPSLWHSISQHTFDVWQGGVLNQNQKGNGKHWIWVEKLIFAVSVTQKEQLSGVFIFQFNFDALLRPPNVSNLKLAFTELQYLQYLTNSKAPRNYVKVLTVLLYK